MPLISVIMPVYNQERYIVPAIQSILNQTFTDFEFIIVDDGSTDNTVEIIKSFKDSRIRLICAEHQGFLNAIKRGAKEAKGKWLARMDSDDICLPDRLEKQLNFLESHPECVFVTSIYGILTPNSKYLAPVNKFDWKYLTSKDITLATTLFSDPGTMYERKLANELGYDDDFENEKVLWYRMLAKGKGAVLGEPLYYARWLLGSVSRSQVIETANLNNQVRLAYDKENLTGNYKRKPVKVNLKNQKRCVYFYITAGDFKSARKTAFDTLRKFPLNPEVWKLVLLSSGIRRQPEVAGPCQEKFSPILPPV